MKPIHSIYEMSGPVLGDALILLMVLIAATLVRSLFLFFIRKYLSRRELMPPQLSVKRHFYPSLWILLLSVMLHLSVPFFGLPEKKEDAITHGLQILIILSATWFLVRVASLAEMILYRYFDISQADNIRQRRARTQIQFVFKVVILGLFILGFAAVLLTFPGARRYGASLLASAGIVTAVVGLAAQKSLGNFLAGFQIAFTQPIRIDDVVIVEGEWGRVEEITLTYVVVKIWDLRRLVLPITYFTEKPFQNWTRTSAKLLGYVYVYADFRVPVEAVRAELERILQGSKLWNGEVCSLQVTDISERTLQLRALMSANDASAQFDLRCEVREKLLAFLQTKYPDSLPRVRLEGSLPASELGLENEAQRS